MLPMPQSHDADHFSVLGIEPLTSDDPKAMLQRLSVLESIPPNVLQGLIDRERATISCQGETGTVTDTEKKLVDACEVLSDDTSRAKYLADLKQNLNLKAKRRANDIRVYMQNKENYVANDGATAETMAGNDNENVVATDGGKTQTAASNNNENVVADDGDKNPDNELPSHVKRYKKHLIVKFATSSRRFEVPIFTTYIEYTQH